MSSGTRVKPEVREPGGRRSGRRDWSSYVSRFGLLIAWAVVAVFFSVLPQTSGNFPTIGNFATIFGSQAVIAILALALVPPLIAGDYDLSVAFTATLSSMLVAVLNVEQHWPIAAAVAVALLAGAFVAVANAAIILFFRIDSLIVTLGTGTFVGVSRQVIPVMLGNGGGSIVNNPSINGLVAAPGADAYTASKGGLVALTRAMAAEWGREGIRVNCICPGPVDTPMNAPWLQDPAKVRFFESSCPLGRVATAEEVAEVALFLASDSASYLNGAVIPVDGGWTAV